MSHGFNEALSLEEHLIAPEWWDQEVPPEVRLYGIEDENSYPVGFTAPTEEPRFRHPLIDTLTRLQNALQNTGPQMSIERLGEASPLLEEMLEALGAKLDGDKIIIPNLGVRKTEDGLEVNVHHRYCRFVEGKWLPLKRVNAETIP